MTSADVDASTTTAADALSIHPPDPRRPVLFPMPHDIPARWKKRVRLHIRQTTGADRDHLNAMDFDAGRSVRLDFPDGSLALFRYAFHLEDADLREAAVFTEHCGYHYFPLGGLRIEVLQSVWPADDEEGDDHD